MICIRVHGMEVERAVHVVSTEDRAKLQLLEDEYCYMEEPLVDYEIDTPIDEWYEGYAADCMFGLEDDTIVIEFGDDTEQELKISEFQHEDEVWNLKEILTGVEGDFMVAIQHVSKGSLSCDLDIPDEDFDPKLLKISTSTYEGEYLFTDNFISEIMYNGEELYMETDSSRSKAFEYEVYPIAEVMVEG
jgi:hypothetical protein